MFPSFISILDIQSWWEVPSIAHFCSLFRAAFNLLDFDIEELEEALLTDGTEDSGSSLLQELIVRLLCGCLGNNDISTFNYQMFLRRLFRQKCQEHGRYNPFNTDIDFQFLPLRTKVEILHTLCDFRLDAEDVLELLKNLEAESLRVEPLGYDDNNSAYWYFYGTRLYREDYEKTSKKNKTKSKSVWQVVCFTEQDWTHLTAKFKGSSSKSEKALFRSLSENFLPEIPRLFQEKERLQRKRLLELQPRRTSNRVQRLRELREEARAEPETAASLENVANVNEIVPSKSAREVRALHRSRSGSEINRVPSPAMPIGRQTNNSLASATGQILIQPVASTYNKKLKTSQVFRQTAEDLKTGMYKILEYVKNHDDAWPFIDPVEEDYAPNYYSVIRKPMDLQRMEEKLDAGEYLTYSRFKSDFQLIVDNCRLYNGSDNEYTEMVDNLQEAFEKATFRFLDQISSSDDEISVEFPEGDKDAVEKNKKANGRKSKKHKAINKKKSKFISKEISNLDDSLKPKAQKQIDTGQKTNRSTSPQESDSNLIEKTKQHKKDAAVVNKQTKTTRTNSRNCKKVKFPVVHRSRSRSKSDRESWTSSPSPPPPRIQKKKKVKENVSDVISDDSVTNLKNKKVDKKQKLNSSSLFDDIDSQFNKKRNNKPVEKYDDENIKTVDIKDRNIRLKDTIAKLKQNSVNNVKDKDSFTKTFDSKQNSKEKIEKVNKKINKKKITDEIVFEDRPKTKTDKVPRFESEFDTESSHTKDSVFTEKKSANQKKSVKKVSGIKSTVALEALELVTEQTLKDINKWLDDTPKYSEFASASNSPSHIISAEEFDIVSAKVENDFKRNLKLEKSTTLVKSKDRTKEILKRRSNNKDFRKAHRRREVQRSIDRLQPGKSKGNLISNMQSNKNDDNVFSLGLLSKSKDTKNSLLVKTDESGPKLSLGTVLDSFGQQHNFVDDKQEQPVLDEKNEIGSGENQEEVSKVNVSPVLDDNSEQVAECKEKESVEDNKQTTVTKATPNFNAWIKAFGAPKSATTIKKKNDTGPDGETDNKRIAETTESSFVADEEPKIKSTPIEDTQRIISPTASLPPESPVAVCQGSSQPAPRTRKASTGSTVSERSSFSQDMTDPLDSPRLSLDERLGLYPAPYPSPMHRSPAAASPVTASPRNDEQQKTSYPPLNGTIRVGFYQDTVKSSPEKSCSPREQPRSPYPQYSSHVYTPSTSTYQYGNPPPYPGPSPSHSPVYTRPHSPVYTQSRSLPSYESAIHNPSYFESERLVNDPSFSNKQSYYFNKMENLSQRGREKVSISSAESRENIGQSRKMVDQPVESHMNNSENGNILRDTDRFQNQQSPVFPVKKRLYNDVSNDTELCTNTVNLPQSSTHESSSIQNSQSSSAINVGLYTSRGKDPNLPVCHRTSDSRDRTAAGDDLRSSKSFDSVPDVPIAKPVPGNNKPFYPSSSELIDSPYCMSERASNVSVQNLKPPNISKPIKTIDLTGSDPVYDRRSSRHLNVPVDMGLPNNRLQHDRNSKISDSYGHVDMTMMNDTIDMSQVQYSRADNFSRNSTKPSDIQSNHQMHLSVSNSIVPGDSQQMTYSGSRGLPLDVNLHHSSLHLPSTELRIPNQRNELSMLNINDAQKSMTNLEMNIPVSQRNDLIHPTPRNNENQLNLRSEHTASMNPANSNYKEDVSSMFNTSSSLMMDAALGLRGNLANLSHIVDRYSSDERLLSGLPTANAQFYQDKTLSNQPVYSKGIPSSIHASNAVSSGLPMFSQPGNQLNTTLALGYRSSSLQQPQSSLKPALTSLSQPQSEKKSRKRKTKPQITSPVAHGSDSSVIDSSNNQGFQSYVGLKNNVSTSEPSAISLKTASVVPGSAFNFGPAPSTLNLSGGLYGDKDGYGGYLDDYRNPATNYYMAAAAAAHHGAPPDVSSDETQRTSQPGPPGPFPFLGHPQARPTYSPLTTPFMPTRAPPLVDPASPLYQQYIQRHQEEILRHSGVLHQGLLGTGYALGMRQPFDVINRPSWL